MPKLSIIIPSRTEPYLSRTVQDVFDNARGEIEVVVHLDGYWPEDWKTITDKYPNLHTVHSGESVGMRAGINKAVASAKSRGAKYVMKLDAHCGLGEGFDEILKADIDDDWVVVPRRKRLDPTTWTLTDTHKPDVDYHYLSFPDDPNDFGGPGLNGKIWPQRAVERAQYEVDEEMSSQGSAWLMATDYFYRLELMNEANYGKFWNEFQEIGLKSWLSSGRVMINKRTWYSHWHKGKAGRQYKLPESWLQQGATFTKNWIYNEAWNRQTKPFKWLIEHFWPVPSWPENWEELLYATRKPRPIYSIGVDVGNCGDLMAVKDSEDRGGLVIHSAYYGIGPYAGKNIDVTDHLRSLVKNDSLDIVVNNSTLTPNQNPFRGKKKHLEVRYSFDGGETVKRQVKEKDWLIIGPAQQRVEGVRVEKVNSSDDELHKDGDTGTVVGENQFGSLVQWDDGIPAGRIPKDKLRPVEEIRHLSSKSGHRVVDKVIELGPIRTAPALNDYLIRKFSISPQRLRGPMPIEVPQFHRNDLAQLFAELGFKRGAEVGVAEGNYSEILLKANSECELLLVDPWHHYSDNPQGKSKERHEFAYNETVRKTAPYPNVRLYPDTSMAAIEAARHDSLDFVYIDGNHLFDYVMEDLIGWSKCVRSGGIISGDDYYALDQKRWTGGGVVEAVQAYTKAHRIPIWWLFAGHKSVDFMWVKP